MCRADLAHRYTDKPDLPARHRGAHPPARRVRGAQPVAPDRGGRGAHRRRVARGVREGRDRHRRTSTSSSSRTPTPAPRSSTWPRTASAPTATRRSWWPTARPRSAAAAGQHRRRAASPTASRSARRGCARSTRWCSSCAARRASGRCPASPQVGYTQLYGAPGTAAATILTT